MKIGIFYGSTTGTTQDVVERIQGLLGGDIFEASQISKATNYDFLIFATSTWGSGDLQDEWESSLAELKDLNLTGKVVGLVGVGDQIGFSDTFVNSIGTLYELLQEKNIKTIGKTSVESYDFSDSTAVVNGEFVGLVIDEANQSDLTDERINKWVEKIKTEL